jgi:hypothetical protein
MPVTIGLAGADSGYRARSVRNDRARHSEMMARSVPRIVRRIPK